MFRAGQHGVYRWIEAPYCSTSLLELAIDCHPGSMCCLAIHDTWPYPDPTRMPAGWASLRHARISPPLVEGLDFGWIGLYDDHPTEWYICDQPLAWDWRPALFSRYQGFSLAPARDLVAEQDPTWDRRAHDWLHPLQVEFWYQLEQVDAVSYILCGATNIVVSRCPQFIKHLPGEDW